MRQQKVDAANPIHDRLPAWRNEAEALNKLSNSLKNDWGLPSSLLKCIVVNGIYNTNVHAIRLMAKHVSDIMSKCRVGEYPPDLVECIAELEWADNKRNFIGFASKLCNLFVDSEAFPIFDTVARETLQISS